MRRVLGTLLATVLMTVIAAVGLALAAAPAQAATARTPVVFVHGFLGDSTNWGAALLAFRAAGYTADELYTYDYNWAGDKTSTPGLGTFVDQVRTRTGHGQVDIVNHSMGGLVTGWYVNGSAASPRCGTSPRSPGPTTAPPPRTPASPSPAASRWSRARPSSGRTPRRDTGQHPVRHLVLAVRRRDPAVHEHAAGRGDQPLRPLPEPPASWSTRSCSRRYGSSWPAEARAHQRSSSFGSARPGSAP